MNIPACFNNIIGIKGSCDLKGNPLPAPSSGYYIQDLTGITLKAAAKVANMNFQNGQNLLQHCINRAMSVFFDTFKIKIADSYRIDTIIETARLGDYSDNYLNYKNHDRGVRIFRNCSNYWIGSNRLGYDNFQYFRLNRVHFLCADTVNGLIVTVQDDIYNTYTYSIDTIAGQVFTLETDLSLRGSTITITTNNQNIRVNEGNKFNGCYPLIGCNGNCGGYSCCGGKIQVQGWNKTESKSYTHNFGIVPEINLECNYESLLCAMKSQLGTILWYSAGIEFLKEIGASDRINEFTSLGNRENIDRQRSEWANGNNTRIGVFIDSCQKMLNSVRDSECVSCKQLSYTQSI